CSRKERPRPPYSTGQSMPAQPSSKSLRCQAALHSRISTVSSGGGFPGSFSCSHVRTSWRNSFTSAVPTTSTVLASSPISTMWMTISEYHRRPPGSWPGSSRHDRETAVDHEGVTGDEARIGADEEDDGPADVLFRVPVSADGPLGELLRVPLRVL